MLNPRVRWWNLIRVNTDELAEKIKVEGSWKQAEDANTTWE